MMKKYFRLKKGKARLAEAEYRGEVVQPTSAAELLRILECPVCTEVPLPPIHTCTRGHIACNTCLSKLATCVLCQSPFTDARNFVMENIVETSMFSCKYKDNGCAQAIRGDLVLDHFKKCRYRNGPIPETHQYCSQGPKNDAFSCYGWKPFLKKIPTNAVLVDNVAGGNCVYVIRAKHPNGTIVPGKLRENTVTAVLSSNGVDLHTTQFEILESIPLALTWTLFVSPEVLVHAVIAGKDNLGRILYVGHCDNEGASFGYVFHDKGYCWASTNGQVYRKSFKVLVKSFKGINLERTSGT